MQFLSTSHIDYSIVYTNALCRPRLPLPLKKEGGEGGIKLIFYKGKVSMRYVQKRAYFNKFRAIQRRNPPKQHVNLKFLE